MQWQNDESIRSLLPRCRVPRLGGLCETRVAFLTDQTEIRLIREEKIST
jgi:hypothetical protein